MIEINGLKKNFGTTEVLKDINLRIEDGEIYGLIGKSGAGKSTLLRCMNGLETYDEGSLKVDGVEVKDLTKEEMRHYQKNVAMIFQQFLLMTRKNAFDNIAFPMRCWGYPEDEIKERVNELAELVDITDKLDHKPKQLSGGQKQRVAIARALSMHPKILFSDEATSALDPSITHSILQLLRKINEQTGITIVIVTHQMDVITEVCEKVSLLQNGEIVASGNTEELFTEQPSELRHFLGKSDLMKKEPNQVEIMLIDERSRNILSRIPVDTGITYTVIDSEMGQYRDTKLGSVLIQVSPEDMPALISYLKKNDIFFH